MGAYYSTGPTEEQKRQLQAQLIPEFRKKQKELKWVAQFPKTEFPFWIQMDFQVREAGRRSLVRHAYCAHWPMRMGVPEWAYHEFTIQHPPKRKLRHICRKNELAGWVLEEYRMLKCERLSSFIPTHHPKVLYIPVKRRRKRKRKTRVIPIQ